jgi:RNA polymerase sigma-70 factor (ECF subfamily)
LFQRAKHNRLGEFERLCGEIEAPLFSYARRLTGDPCEAEDVAQEALLRLFRAMQGGRPPQSPRAFVFSIAHNLAMDVHRKRQRKPMPEAREAPSPETMVARSLLRAEIERALDALPADQRAALLLREFGELSYAEIAQTMSVEVSMVKTWIFRARRKLSTLLDRDGQYIGENRPES